MKLYSPRQSGPGAVFVVDVYEGDKLIAQFFGATGDEASNRAKCFMKPDEDDAALYGADSKILCAKCKHTFFDHANGTRGCDYRAHGNALQCNCGEWVRP